MINDEHDQQEQSDMDADRIDDNVRRSGIPLSTDNGVKDVKALVESARGMAGHDDCSDKQREEMTVCYLAIAIERLCRLHPAIIPVVRAETKHYEEMLDHAKRTD